MLGSDQQELNSKNSQVEIEKPPGLEPWVAILINLILTGVLKVLFGVHV